jgi:acyl carrier protein
MPRQVIVDTLTDYIRKAVPSLPSDQVIPLDTSLYEVGILDSFGVVELVDFVETHWRIKIHDSELTQEKFGGINKMTNLIEAKLREA